MQLVRNPDWKIIMPNKINILAGTKSTFLYQFNELSLIQFEIKDLINKSYAFSFNYFKWET